MPFTTRRAQGFHFAQNGEPSSVGRNLFGAPHQTDSPRQEAAGAQLDLRRGLADLKAATADGSLRRADSHLGSLVSVFGTCCGVARASLVCSVMTGSAASSC